MSGSRVDVSGRPIALRDLDLDRFFRPRTVLVLGASDSEGRPATGMTRKIRGWAEAKGATVHYVNPNRDAVDGQPCHRSVEAVPDDDIDLAVILTGNAIEGFVAVQPKAPRYAVIFAAGFAEVGADGEALQASLAELVEASSTHLLGPNTNLNAFELFRDDVAGRKVALITQSGHQGRPIFQAQDLGIGLGYWAPTGNEVDLEFADFAAWFASQPEVGVVSAYIEGFKDGRTLQLAADRCASLGVPIVCVKVGRTEAGRSMAKSHTGHLTGSDAVTSAVFRQHGVTRVRGLDELQDTAAMLARAEPPVPGGGVCIYAISGGTGAHMADMAAEVGLPLPTLTAASQAALHEWIPPYLRVSNPVDSGGHPSADWRGRKILDTIVADPNVAAVVVPITGSLDTMSMPFAQDLVDVAETTDKPICVIWGSPIGTEDAHALLRSSSRVVTFRTFGNCVGAVKAWFDWHAFLARRRGGTKPLVRRSVPRFDLGPALTEHESKLLLAAYGIPITREEVVGSAAEAVKAAEAIGFPVVLKASSPDVAHKSDLGLVRLGLRTAAEVRRAFAELASSEVLVAEMVPLADATECVVGVSHDELFGPVVLFGLGGVFVEVLRDVTFRVPPFDAAEARRMIDEVAGVALLRGARGRPVGDEAALVDALVRVGRLALEQASVLAELDINPLVVRPKGLGVVALDALAIPSVRPVAIAGVGQTEFAKALDDAESVLALRAIGLALDDAGLDASAVDGLFSYTLETTDEVDIARNLGCADVTAFAQVGYGGGAGCGVVGLAAMAVAAGQCEVAVAWRSRKRGAAASRPWANVAARLSDFKQWTRPFGLLRPVDEIAVLARRYLHEFGYSRSDLAAVALAGRAFALRNPAAMMHGRPLTLDDYLSARMISEPLCLFDNCLESDGAGAVVVCALDRARDLPSVPVVVDAWAQSLPQQHQTMTNYFGEDPLVGPSYACAARLWANASVGAADVDVAQLYDAFSPLVPMSLEGYGFCARGEGLRFFASGEAPPINTSGGGMSEAYVHGFNLIVEAARQIRGTSPNPVPGAEVSLVTSGEGVPTSAMVLVADR